MAFVTLAEARMHLRHDSNTSEDDLIELWLTVAEQQCVAFLGRNVYADEDALIAAQIAAPGYLEAARIAYESALLAAADVANEDERRVKEHAAHAAYVDAQNDYMAAMQGMVVNESVRAAVLLLMAQLFEQRTPQARMPSSQQALLWPYRVGLGV
jgi:hypothetical protein